MATKVEAPSEPKVRERRIALDGLGTKLRDSWWVRHWQTLLIMFLVLALAFFVRTYFAYDVAVNNGYAVSGGADPYYELRVIDYITTTGQTLLHDPLLNYPFGSVNPRLPLYSWSVAVSGELFSAVTGTPVSSGTSYMLELSTAFWGALTVIPVFLVGRTVFGNKAGLIAAFLFALMPGAMTQSMFSDGRHGAISLFFTVFTFYFLILSLNAIKGNRWVSSYRKPRNAISGLSSYVKMNQISLIYSLLAAVSMAAVAFAWEGYMYLIIIILLYFAVQILVNCFKKIDSLGVLMSVGVMLTAFFILAFPVYWQTGLFGTWYDVPLILSVMMIVVGIIFVITRDHPWTLVVPIFIILVVAAMAALSAFAPNLFDAVITGQGYLVKSKLYSTISEAQAPSFSTLVLSFGAVTFWLAIVGLAMTVYKIPKNLASYFVFVAVWMAAAIFMAMSAARFLFIAAPVFAISAGWILVLIVQALKLEELPKGLSGIRLRNPLPALRKGIKIRHVAGVLFLTFLIILPNVWTAVDAAIPSSTKNQYDEQIYDNLPQILRPDSYNSSSQPWYLGAFSYDVPTLTEYYPAAWSWFAMRDASITPVVDRPAYLSWWDYGFEAIQEGQHPTVADNFQNGYNFAGEFITCTNESQAIAMLVTLAIQGGTSETSQVNAILTSYGVNVALVRDAITNPSKYISVVMDNPSVYGSFDMDNSIPSAKNAMYVFLRVELSTELTKEQLVSLNGELRSVTGVNVGYFAIDTRLFPFSATGSNIFYAPAKLADYYIDPYSGAPTEFYQIYAVDSNGSLIQIQNVTSSMTIVKYDIVYTSAFYETMLYRAFMGFGPADLGLTSQGLPGLSGSLASYQPMQGWNMSNFRLVYKTAYYNPYPASMVANHTDAWQAIGYDEAVSIQAAINAGTMTGVVDTSADTLESGVVFLQYYDGAIIKGQATTANGKPYPNVYVTVDDQYGIPHEMVKTDSNGNYEVIAPFGAVNVTFTVGTYNNRTMMGSDELGRISLNITYDQAMRQGDYIFDRNIVLSSSVVSGRVFWNLAGSSTYDSASDQTIAGATVYLQNSTTGYKIQTTTAADGTYSLEGVPPMTAQVFADVNGHNTNSTTITIQPLVNQTVDIGISPGSISGTLERPDGTAVPSFSLDLKDLVNGSTITQSTSSTGSFDFGKLLPGNYQLASSLSNLSLGGQVFKIVQGQSVNRTFTVSNAMTVSGQILTQAQLPAGNVTVGLISQASAQYVETDANGNFDFDVPSGNYTLYTVAVINSREYAAMTAVPATTGYVTFTLTLQSAGMVTGTTTGTSGVAPLVRFQSRTNGGVYYAKANSSGSFGAVLPVDNYFVYINSTTTAYWADLFVSGDMSVTFNLVTSSDINGVVYYDANGNGVVDQGERLANALVTVSDGDGRTITQMSASDGSFSANLVPGREYTTSVSLPGFGSQSFTLTLGSGVTHNFDLVPFNRTVSGTVSYQSSALSGLTVTLQATVGSGAVSATAVTDGLGQFSVSLHPGTYTVVVAENVTLGSNATQYQYTQKLTASVGSDPAPLSIGVARRILVSVTITSPSTASATVVISGTDASTRQTTANFTTYLTPGTYSAYAYQQRFAQRYASLASYEVSSATPTIAITMTSAYQVSGDTSYSGSPFYNIASIDVTNLAGGTYTFSSLTSGTFTVILPAGDYNISADSRLKQDISLHTTRYVRYDGYQDISLAANTNIHVALTRTFDNATVVGQAFLNGAGVSATLVLSSISSTAVNATITATSAGYNTSVAPGNYSVYAREIGGTGAFLGLLEVDPYVTNFANLTLVDGLPFSGSTLVNNVGVSAMMTISNGNTYNATTGADGSFLIYLPPGVYQVKATAQSSELGVSATYTSQFSLNLTAPTGRTINLAKVATHGVDVQWDSSQKQTITAGQSVAYTVRVVNTGNVADTFIMTASGATSGWTMTFSQTSVDVGFGTQNSQLVTVYITSPSSATVSHQTLSVRATSISNSSATDSVTLSVGIVPRYGVSMDYYQASSTSGTTFSYSLNVTNTGNLDDNFNVTVANQADLTALGWNAEVRTGSGAFASYFNVQVSAGSKAIFDLRLTAIRANPNPQVTVVLTATSKASPTKVATLGFTPVLPEFAVPSNGLSVTGNGVVQSVPNLPASTLILLGLVIAMFTIMFMVALQKGVFRRRKR